MLPIVVVLAISWFFTQLIFDGRERRAQAHQERMEYAKKGLPPPPKKRLAAGYTGETKLNPDAPFREYVKAVCGDVWRDAKKRHDRERAARRADGGRTARQVAKDWWKWAAGWKPTTAQPGEGQPAQKPATAAEPATEPATPEPQAATGTESALPAADDKARYCADCGKVLIEHPDGWWHPKKALCPVTGKEGPYGKPTQGPEGTPPPLPDPPRTPRQPQEFPPPAGRVPVHAVPHTGPAAPICGISVPLPEGHRILKAPADVRAGTTQGGPHVPFIDLVTCGLCKVGLISGVPAPGIPKQHELRKCGCGEILVGDVNILGHVCPMLVDLGTTPVRLARPPVLPADADQEDPEELERITNAHSAGNWCQDPLCDECLSAGRVPEAEKLTPSNNERRRRDFLHDIGKTCGIKGCSCTCQTCRKGYASEPGRLCVVCWARQANEEDFRARFDIGGPNCRNCQGYRVFWAPQNNPPSWVCLDCGTLDPNTAPPSPVTSNGKEPVTESPSDAGAAGPTSNTNPNSTSNGGKTMALEFDFDAIVRAHQQMATELKARLEQVSQVKQHAAAARAASDGMDNAREALVTSANTLVEAMTDARFDTASVEGCVTAAEAFSSDDAARIEEMCDALTQIATRVEALTSASAEAVQTSLNHIRERYGALAEGVQSTGIKGEVLEAH